MKYQFFSFLLWLIETWKIWLTDSVTWLIQWLVDWFIAEHKVIIVGLDNAGKTTILYQL